MCVCLCFFFLRIVSLKREPCFDFHDKMRSQVMLSTTANPFHSRSTASGGAIACMTGAYSVSVANSSIQLNPAKGTFGSLGDCIFSFSNSDVRLTETKMGVRVCLCVYVCVCMCVCVCFCACVCLSGHGYLGLSCARGDLFMLQVKTRRARRCGASSNR